MNETVTVGAKLVAERRQVLQQLVVAVRDQSGARHDFSAAANWPLGTSQKEFTASRSFAKAGVYTYWVAYRKAGKWFNLPPRQSFTVGGASSGPAPSPSASATVPSPSPSPVMPSPSATTTSPPPPPITSGPPSGSFPNADNTGVPSGTQLTAYTGSCTITADNALIDAKVLDCDVTIRARNVVIRRSVVNGFVSSGDGTSYSFTLADSNVNATTDAPRLVTGLGADNFTVLRSEITGGNRGIYCRRNCEVRDSWIHGTKVSGDWHASGIRASQGSRIIHNRIACDTQPTPQDGGCSADLTMYGDFEPVRDVWVENNLFVANTGAAFCSYGGSSGGKPYSSDAANVAFVNNTFQRGTNRNCGAYGPITDFDPSRPGNQFTGNVWDDSTAVRI